MMFLLNIWRIYRVAPQPGGGTAVRKEQLHQPGEDNLRRASPSRCNRTESAAERRIYGVCSWMYFVYLTVEHMLIC